MYIPQFLFLFSFLVSPLYHFHEIFFDEAPISFVERYWESVRPWGFILMHSPDSFFYLFLSYVSVERVVDIISDEGQEVLEQVRIILSQTILSKEIFIMQGCGLLYCFLIILYVACFIFDRRDIIFGFADSGFLMKDGSILISYLQP